jgi:excisionase family DNA binding protein
MTHVDKDTLTYTWGVAEVAEYLNVAESTVQRLARTNAIPFRRALTTGKPYRFRPDDIAAWATQQAIAPGAQSA